MKEPNIIPRFNFWDPGTWTIPKLYWDAFSQEQRIHAICKQLAKLIGYADYISNQVNENSTDISELQTLFEQFMESGFDDYYAKQIEEWVNENLAYLYETLVKQVYFGLTSDGHFAAYIPESWSDITFDTGAVYGRSDYGRLILRFASDGAVDNTYDYDYSAAQTLELQQAIADLETIISRSDLCYDTLFTNLDEEV